MKTDFLIIGQGIAGTLLSYRLLAAGHSVLVLDEGGNDKASKVAGAVINPFSGKNWTPAPEANVFIPAAIACYRELEALLQLPVLQQLPLYVFPADPGQSSVHLQPAYDMVRLSSFFTADNGILYTPDTWLVDAATLLDGWRQYLQGRDSSRKDIFIPAACRISDEQVVYRDITAGQIIFCEGAAAVSNPLFAALPFTRNRGEALLLHLPDLPAGAIYNQGLRLVPRSDGLFWCGSNYRWSFTSLEPDTDWRTQAVAILKQWLRVPFGVVDHVVAERPTTAGQLPFIGMHPGLKRAGILNGLGTRGFSAGPYWAGELARQLTEPGYKIRNYREDLFRSRFC